MPTACVKRQAVISAASFPENNHFAFPQFLF
jgi:hypothetical protein